MTETKSSPRRGYPLQGPVASHSAQAYSPSTSYPPAASNTSSPSAVSARDVGDKQVRIPSAQVQSPGRQASQARTQKQNGYPLQNRPSQAFERVNVQATNESAPQTPERQASQVSNAHTPNGYRLQNRPSQAFERASVQHTSQSASQTLPRQASTAASSHNENGYPLQSRPSQAFDRGSVQHANGYAPHSPERQSQMGISHRENGYPQQTAEHRNIQEANGYPLQSPQRQAVQASTSQQPNGYPTQQRHGLERGNAQMPNGIPSSASPYQRGHDGFMGPQQDQSQNARPQVPATAAPQKTDARNGARPVQKKSNRRLSLSYPLQARPSQLFRDDMDIPKPTQSRELDVTATEPSKPPMVTRPLNTKKGYPLQVMPPSPSPQRTAAPFQADTPSQAASEPRGVYGPQATSPLYADLPNGHTAGFSPATQERFVHRHPGPPQFPPAPSLSPSENTAISSGRASEHTLKRRQPFQFQPAASDQPSTNSRLHSPAAGSNAGPAPGLERTGSSHPRLPRNIRAMKDGQNGKIPGRTIVICLDGTGDKFDADNSNIVHLVSCLKKSDPNQLTYYQSGIGTYDGGGLSNGVNAALDMAIGSGLGVHIRDAYHFLMQNYTENDRICIFGFSRGAYTARCLAGMVHKVGLLPRHNTQQLPFAYEYYKDDTENGWEMSKEFKRTFSVDVSVHFIGVFDSVASVGFIPRTLPLSSTPYNKATYFRHALALDEHRAKFKAKQFEKKDSIDPNAQWETVAESRDDAIEKHEASRQTSASSKLKPDVFESADDGFATEADLYVRQKREAALSKQTDVLEVWFAGAHADVGGGAEKNVVRHKLAQIPLRWMLRQCFECDTGIIFKVHRLAEEGLDIHTLWPKYYSPGIPSMGPSPSLMEKYEDGKIAPISRRATVLKPVDMDDPEGPHDVVLWTDEEKRRLHEDWVPEHVEDYFDCISRLNDQLVGATAWWILEVWPIKVRVQLRDSEEWAKKISVNLGRYRAVQDLRPNLHWTVKQRMEATGYRINARTSRNAAWNIVA